MHYYNHFTEHEDDDKITLEFSQGYDHEGKWGPWWFVTGWCEQCRKANCTFSDTDINIAREHALEWVRRHQDVAHKDGAGVHRSPARPQINLNARCLDPNRPGRLAAATLFGAQGPNEGAH